MKRNLLLAFVLLHCLLFSCTEKNKAPIKAIEIALIPEPVEMAIKDGVFELNSETRFIFLDEVIVE